MNRFVKTASGKKCLKKPLPRPIRLKENQVQFLESMGIWSTPERTKNLLGLLRRLVQEMARQVVVANPHVHSTLQKDIKLVLHQMDAAEDPSQPVESALRLVRDYNLGLAEVIRNVTGAMPQMLSRFTSSLELVQSSSENMLRRLDQFQQSLASIKDKSDLESVRRDLTAWLDTARFDTLEQSTTVSEGIRQFIGECQEVVEKSTETGGLHLGPGTSAESLDPLTGLPGRDSAEAMLERLVTQKYSYAAIFDLDRVQTIRTRYGLRGRDQLIIEFSHFLAKTLCNSDSLFRWTESSFLGVVPQSSATQETVRVEDLRKLALTRHVCDLEFGGRTALVPITFRYKLWYASGLAAGSLLEEIDSFVVQQATANAPGPSASATAPAPAPSVAPETSSEPAPAASS